MRGTPLIGRGRVPIRLALNYWRRHWLRALLMVLGLTVGLTLLAAVLLVNDSLSRTYSGFVRGVVGWAELEVSGSADAGLDGRWLQTVREAPGVGAAAPVLERRSYLFVDQVRLGVSVRGVEPAAEESLRPFSIVAGRQLEPGDTQVALLSYAAAVELDAGPGSDVSLLTPEGVEMLRVVGVYHPFGDAAASERVVQLWLPQAQALFTGGRNALTRIDVATDGSAVGVVAETLRNETGGAVNVGRAADAAGDLTAASRGLRMLLIGAGLLALLAAGVLISVYLRTVVAERSADLGLLQRLGVTRARVRTWLATEVAAVVLVASLPALLLAAPVATLVLRYVPSDLLPFAANVAAPRVGATVLPLTVIIGAVGAVVTLLAVRYLLLRLLSSVGGHLLRAHQGRALLRLAGHFLLKRLAPTATVAAMLVLTTAGLVGVHGATEANRRSLAAWLDGAVTWDLLVASGPPGTGSDVPLPHAAVAELAALPGVEAVSAQRQVAVSSRGQTVTMIALDGFGLDAGNRLSVVHSADLTGSAVWFSLHEGNGVALSVPLANRLAVGVGDRLPLTTLEGESEFTVVALVDDASSRAEAAYIALDNYAAMWGDSGVDSVLVRLSPGAEAVALAELVATLAPQRAAKVPLHVTLADSYRAGLLAAATDTYRAATLMVLLALLIALLALLASSLAAAWQAEPELRGLRAMGVPSARLATVLLANLLLTAGVGVLPGMLLGTLMSRPLSSSTVGAGQFAWNLPLGAYVSVLVLVVLTAAFAAALLVAPRAGFSRGRPQRR